ENEAFIAAVNRCATQRQKQNQEQNQTANATHLEGHYCVGFWPAPKKAVSLQLVLVEASNCALHTKG
ncbi:MAG: hypothetical protein WBP70_10600, partial [Terriglobales bacterium]